MQRSVLAIAVISATVYLLSLGPHLWAGSAVSDATFQALSCGTCHKPDKKGSGPTLQEIARAYVGKQEQLVRYFMGESIPLIDTGKRKTMERQLSKTRELSDEERKDLASYILSFR